MSIVLYLVLVHQCSFTSHICPVGCCLVGLCLKKSRLHIHFVLHPLSSPSMGDENHKSIILHLSVCYAITTVGLPHFNLTVLLINIMLYIIVPVYLTVRLCWLRERRVLCDLMRPIVLISAWCRCQWSAVGTLAVCC